MTVLLKYLSREPAENLAAALYYRFDRIVFFCLEEILAERRQDTERFLLRYCNVQSVDFRLIEPYDLSGSIEQIRSRICAEKEASERILADLTGARGLCLAAFGSLWQEPDLSMFICDLPSLRFIALSGGGIPADPQTVNLDLNRYIEMRGGVINYRMHKEIKGINNRETDERIEKIWRLFERYEKGWSFLAGIFQKVRPDDALRCAVHQKEIRDALKKQPQLSEEFFRDFVRDAGQEGIFCDVRISPRIISFSFENRMIRNCLTDAGSILELQVYRRMRAASPNSKVGVHLDWDGVIHSRSGEDVVNEIDVIALKGLVPVFISCKIGRATKNALYELSAVTRRFGGKYAKMILVTAGGMSDTDLRRAGEMEIEVVDRNLEPWRPVSD